MCFTLKFFFRIRLPSFILPTIHVISTVFGDHCVFWLRNDKMSKAESRHIFCNIALTLFTLTVARKIGQIYDVTVNRFRETLTRTVLKCFEQQQMISNGALGFRQSWSLTRPRSILEVARASV